MNELALFAGAGGGILGGYLLGWRTVCAVEIDPYAASVLIARQNDGILSPFPIWDDVRTFDGRPWRGRVDVISGGFPCQDISAAGRGVGITGERSGLWKEFARIIGEVRPLFVLVENSPMLTLRGLDVVLGDLASMGFDAEWGVLGADDAGAPHIRKRIWILAYSDSAELRVESRRFGWTSRKDSSESRDDGETESVSDTYTIDGITGNEPTRRKEGPDVIGICEGSEMADTTSSRNWRLYEGSRRERKRTVDSNRGRESWWSRDPADVSNTEGEGLEKIRRKTPFARLGKFRSISNSNVSGSLPSAQTGIYRPEKGRGSRDVESERQNQWGIESRVGRVAHGVAARVDRLKAIGNGQVPSVVELAWETLIRRIL